MRGPHAGENGRVTGRRLRDGVVLIAVSEERALRRQLAQSPGQLSLPAGEVVGSELVDGDHDHELGPRRRRTEHPAEECEIDGEVHGPETSDCQAVAATSWGRSRNAMRPATATTPAAIRNGTPCPSASKTNVAPTGPTMLAMPRSVCWAPMTNPNSCRGTRWLTSEVDAGNSSAVPTGTSVRNTMNTTIAALGGSSAAGSGIKASPRNKEIVPSCMVRISP